ncbi:MAG: DUF502 domain-containing protein [Rhodospirillales bacterium]|nr:DUF502 domain-containing protein [Rhodospirillales bacterium]
MTSSMSDGGRFSTAGRKLRRRLGARLRAYFIAGVLITGPTLLTLYLAALFISFVDRQVASFIPDRYTPDTYLPFGIPGVGIIVVVVGLTLIGALTAGVLGRVFVRVSENLLVRMPVIRSFHGTFKQIFETILAARSTAFREAVLLEYPRAGTWTIGFVTSGMQGEIARRLDDDTIGVFVPTTPNPTSGFLLFVPRDSLVYLDMTVEEAFKLVISGGLVTPPDRTALSRPGS